MNMQEKADSLLNPTIHIMASPSMIRDFARNIVWQDFQSVLRTSLENLRDELETMGSGTGYTPEEIPYAMAFLQGQAFQIRKLLDLPELILTIKLEEESDERP